MKIAIIHDWLVTYAGAERALEQLLHCFPNADLFAVVDFFSDEQRRQHLLNKKATTTYIQKFPLSKRYYRTYLPFMPMAIEQLDVSGYDLIISNSHAVAKGVLTGPDQLHIGYVHSPMRYAWDMYHQYLRAANLTKGLKGLLAKKILHKMRMWDLRTVNGVDEFIGNSSFIAKRIWKTYRREAAVIYPPVDTDYFQPAPAASQGRENRAPTSVSSSSAAPRADFYVTASRLVPYKRVDLIVQAFAKMPNKKLVVIGDGPEAKKVRALATSNVELLGFQENEVVRSYMQRAKAFIFAAEEDFGIVPLEAQACGTAVIAYGKGGCTETIVPAMDAATGAADTRIEAGMAAAPSRPTGVFFYEQTAEAIVAAVKNFESITIDPTACRANAERFSIAKFRETFTAFVSSKWEQYIQNEAGA